MKQAISEVVRCFEVAWRLRWPFIQSHLVFNILLAAAFAPLMAATVHLALTFSGKPALADFDIAVFLLSPVGFVAGLVIAGMALVLLTLDVSFMMAVALRDRVGKSHGFLDGVAVVLPRVPAVLGLAVQFSIRLLLMCLPFLAVCGLAFFSWMTEFDINYYLSFHPPEFVQTVVVCGIALAVMMALVLWRTLGWVLALPLVVFDGLRAGEALRESQSRMAGRRLTFLVRLAIWAAIGAVIGGAVLFVVGAIIQFGLHFVPFGLKGLAAFLLLSTGLWAGLNLVLTSFTTGALAVAFIGFAGWPDAGEKREVPKGVLSGLVMVAALVTVLGGFGVAELVKVDQDRPVAVIAHRGASAAAPENTMAAVTRAVEDQADWVEIDVQETADGAVVVVHDSDFMKVAGNPLKIWDATLEDLKAIDIGSWFDSAFTEERTATLEDVLLAAKDKSGVVIELKYYGHDEDLEQRVIDIVEATDMVDQVKIMSLKADAVTKMRKLRPDWNVGLLASASLGNMWDLDVDFLAVNSATMSRQLVRGSHDAGKEVYVWTVNDPLSMSGMLSFGVDGLITDEPALARQVLADRKTLSGVERLVLGLAGRIGLDVPHRGDDEVQ